MLNIPAARGSNGGVPTIITAMFGDGVDGAMTLVSGQAQVLPEWIESSDYITYDILRDANPTTLTVGAGCTLRTHGWSIIASESIINNGTIHADGVDADGPNGGRDVPVGTDWPYSIPALVGFQTTPDFNAGYHGSTNSDGDATYNRGGGGYGGPGGGGPAGNDGEVDTFDVQYKAVFRSPGYPGESRYVPHDVMTACFVPSGESGGGGGSSFGTGGGGGMGGQIIELCAPTITNTGTIRAKGGNGGSFGGLPDAGCGGGGGGGGGMIFITYTIAYTNTGTVSCPGGTGGSGTLGNDGQGRDGLDGGDGPVIILAL